MDCSAFRRHHVAFVDDTLPGDLLVAAARHVAECAECARHDTAVRRSLLLARNICGRAEVECTPDFQARLEARLRRGDGLDDRSGLPADDWAPRWWEVGGDVGAGRPGALGRLVTPLRPRRTRQALAAAAMLAAVSTGALFRPSEPPMEVRGLGSGPLVTWVDAPFTPVAADGSTFGAAAYEGGVVPAAGLGGMALSATGNAAAADLVAYDGTLDAGALVAPASVGVPVWAAAVLAGEVPATLWRGDGQAAVQLGRGRH